MTQEVFSNYLAKVYPKGSREVSSKGFYGVPTYKLLSYNKREQKEKQGKKHNILQGKSAALLRVWPKFLNS